MGTGLFGLFCHDDVIKWKHFPRYWPFVRGIHRSTVNSPHKGQWRGALMFSLMCAWINIWVNNREAGDLRRYRHHYDVIAVASLAWWSHQMETLSALLALCAGNSPVTVEFPAQRPVKQNIDVFFDLCLNKWLSKQSWGWWFETPSRSLWHHCNGYCGNRISYLLNNV